jgi:hypothetical protein
LKKKYNHLIRVTVYVEPEMYDALKNFAPPGRVRWESGIVHKVLEEFLDSRKIPWRPTLQPLNVQPGQRVDTIKDAPASAAKRGQRSQPR